MREKLFLFRYLNARAIKSGVFSVVCGIGPVGKYLNYVRDTEYFEDAAEPGSLRAVEIDPVEQYGIRFSQDEIDNLLRGGDASADTLRLIFRMARVADVTVLGSSGVSIRETSGRALSSSRAETRLHPNRVVARPLKLLAGRDDTTYINLLGIRRGHRHFAHFFWDLMLPVMVYLKNWLDPDEAVTFLVREDLSPVQKDTFRFVAADFPNVSFQTLAANAKIRCQHLVFLGHLHKVEGVTATLVREYMRNLADLYLRHYGVANVDGEGTRLYVSRQSAALRTVRNEAALVEMLSLYGFESHDPGTMPFSEQAALFRSADIIVAPHGAALANLMFCRPGTRVLEFFPANFREDCFLRLCKAMELEYHYLVAGRGIPPKMAFHVDPQELETALVTLLGGIETSPR